jgi:hypothetical protein
MVRKLLFSHQKLSFLIAGIVGSMAGVVLLLSSLQLYIDFDKIINGNSDLNAAQYFTINKQVSVINTLFGGQKGFDEDEIKQLKSIEGVVDVAPLTASHFKVGVSMDGNMMEGMPGLGMYTDMFFEAVPDDFIDVSREEWKWEEGDSLIPIVVPKDYINLYNFGFAPTQNLPPVTEDMVGMLPLKVTLTTPKGKIIFQGKIVGLSERLNTILAPQTFIDYANKNYSNVEPGSQASSRVIIKSDGPATSQLIDYFEENGYETSEESLRNSMLNSVLNTIMSICVVIGTIIIFLALMVFILYSQLVIAKSSYEIQTLVFIGYSPRKLIATYMKYYLLLFTGLITAGMAGVYFIKLIAKSIAKDRGFTLQSGIDIRILILAAALLAFFLIFNYLSVRKNVLRLAKNR